MVGRKFCLLSIGCHGSCFSTTFRRRRSPVEKMRNHCPHAWHQQQHRGRMWAASPAFRRRLFLLRSLSPSPCAALPGNAACSSSPSPSTSIRVNAMSASGPVYEADAEAVVRRITPPLDRARHKGQAGEPARPLSLSCALRGGGFRVVVLLMMRSLCLRDCLRREPLVGYIDNTRRRGILFGLLGLERPCGGLLETGVAN